MTREELKRASEELRAASQAAEGDRRERLYEHSDQLARLASAERGPDHGRLARHLHALEELREGANEDVADRIETAREEITAYRETVEGV